MKQTNKKEQQILKHITNILSTEADQRHYNHDNQKYGFFLCCSKLAKLISVLTAFPIMHRCPPRWAVKGGESCFLIYF